MSSAITAPHDSEINFEILPNWILKHYWHLVDCLWTEDVIINLLTEWELVYVHVNCSRAQHRLIWAEQSLGNLFPAPAARGVRPMALVTRGMPERWIFSSEGLLLSTWKNFSSSPLMNGLQPWCNQIHLKMAQDDKLKILLQSNLSILMTHTHFSSLSSLVSWRYDENMSVRR